MNGICALVMETPAGSLTLLPCEDTASSLLSMHQELGSQQTPNLLAFDLGLLGFSTARNECLLF